MSPRPPSSTGAAPAGSAPEPGFEEALARLEAVVRALESGDLPLEQTLAQFEEGQRLLGLCSRQLAAAELKVKELLKQADGGFAEAPWRGQEGSDAAP